MPSHLPGAVDPSQWSLNAPHGPVPQVLDEIFPILRQALSGDWELIGTGFYISVDGLFVTAKHVLEDIVDPDTGEQTCPVAIFHLLKERPFPSGRYLIRPVASAAMSHRSDIALGVAMAMTNNASGAPLVHNALALRLAPSAVPGPAATYAYPNRVLGRDESGRQTIEFNPALYKGTVDEAYPDGRDRARMPWPSYGLTMHIHGGASGGPVLDATGQVFAVNNSSMHGAEDVSFATSLADLFDCYVKSGAPLDERIMLSELIAAGVVRVDTEGKAMPVGDHARVRHVAFTKTPGPSRPVVVTYVAM